MVSTSVQNHHIYIVNGVWTHISDSFEGALSFVTKCFFWSHLMPTRRCSSSSVRSVRNVLLSWLSGFHIHDNHVP